MGDRTLSKDEQVCCYFLRELGERAGCVIVTDLTWNCFSVRNEMDGALSEYFLEDWRRPARYYNLWQVFKDIEPFITEQLEEYISKHDGEEGNSELQYCKLGVRFMNHPIVKEMMTNITSIRVLAYRQKRGLYGLGDVLSMLRQFDEIDKGFYFVE